MLPSMRCPPDRLSTGPVESMPPAIVRALREVLERERMHALACPRECKAVALPEESFLAQALLLLRRAAPQHGAGRVAAQREVVGADLHVAEDVGAGGEAHGVARLRRRERGAERSTVGGRGPRRVARPARRGCLPAGVEGPQAASTAHAASGNGRRQRRMAGLPSVDGGRITRRAGGSRRRGEVEDARTCGRQWARASRRCSASLLARAGRSGIDAIDLVRPRRPLGELGDQGGGTGTSQEGNRLESPPW